MSDEGAKSLLSARARDAELWSAWLSGTGPHPHGVSGHRWLIPYLWNRRMTDGGEWARGCGLE